MRAMKAGVLALVLVLLPAAGRCAAGSDSLVESAWRAWEVPDYGLAEKQFRAAIAADPSNERACVGLALLENMRDRSRSCWEALQGLIRIDPQPYPYIFSFGNTLRFRLKDEFRETGLLTYLETLADSADGRGVLSAQVTEGLEEYYRERKDLPEAARWRARMNAVSDWLLIGPFENVSASGYEKAYPPETGFDAGATYEGKGGVPVSWFPIASSVPGTWIDFTRHFAYRQSIYYANTFVYAPQNMNVHLRVGTSGSLRAFLNDELVIEYADENNNDLDTYVVATQLQQGWNRLLIKCGYSEIDKCNFLVRITDARGHKIDGLRYSTAAQTYTRKPGAPAAVLDNAFETFFREAVAAHPDRPENYALLAQLYLRDDKAPQAELILRDALKQWPRCTQFYTLMMETYLRGKKRNEIEDLLSKIRTVDDRLPAVLQYRISEAMRDEDFQKAEELIGELRSQGYDPEAVYQADMELLGKRKEIDKLVALVRKAYAEFPMNWQFASLQALVESEINHSAEKAAEVVAGFLKRKYGIDQLNTMAGYYLKAGKLDQWEAAMNEAIERDPTTTGYIYSMGYVYQQIKNYAKAEEMYRRALALCPSSALYWSRLAEVYKATGRTDDAKNAYRASLKVDPRDFAIRDALRAMEGKKPVYSIFSSYPVDSLVHAAPGQAAYPDDNGVILLDDTKRVVFERGASMVMNEALVKVFNAKGIDTWKEYSIGYNSYNEELIVEKALTIKKDGTEVKADVNGGDIVFKSLEPNECIYLKWKVKNYYSGMLSQHFWDTHYFNGGYPVAVDRYTLLVPRGLQFNHRTQLAPDAPTVRETEDGTVYEWLTMHEPGMRYEVNMPGSADVARVLFVSSIPSWNYVANWFSDLALAKTQSSFEIREKVAALLGDGKAMSDEQKVKAVYDFITENIRYSSVSFRQSAYIPQRARDVLVQRLGDCKDVSTLCIAMLQEAGVKAHYVLVNTWDDGQNRNIPPSIAFNHCIVGVDLKSGVRYLDLTASDFPVGSIPPNVTGAFALPIEGGSNTPIYLQTGQPAMGTVRRSTAAILNEDASLKVVCSSRRTGPAGAYIRARYRNKSHDECLKDLSGTLSGEYPNVHVDDVQVKDIDRLDPAVEDIHAYTVPGFVTEAGGFRLMRVPWADRLHPSEALAYDTRTYPCQVRADGDTNTEVVHIKLPPGYTLAEVPKGARLTDAVGEYSVSYAVAGKELIATRTFIQKKLIVEPAEYQSYKKFYNDALRQDERQFVLKKGK